VKLRTFDGEPVLGEMTTDSPVSQDGMPVLLVNDEPFSPEEAEFFLESATQKELEMLEEGGYALPEWEGRSEGYEEVEQAESDDN
jgi:hypothetical protein